MALDPREKDARTFGRVLDIIVEDDTRSKVTLGQMYESEDCQKHGGAHGEQGTGYACERVHVIAITYAFSWIAQDPGELKPVGFPVRGSQRAKPDELSRFAARALPHHGAPACRRDGCTRTRREVRAETEADDAARAARAEAD